MPTDVAHHSSGVWSDRDADRATWFAANPQISLGLQRSVSGRDHGSGPSSERYDAATISDTFGLELIEDVQGTQLPPGGVEHPLVDAAPRRPASRHA